MSTHGSGQMVYGGDHSRLIVLVLIGVEKVDTFGGGVDCRRIGTHVVVSKRDLRTRTKLNMINSR